MVEIKKVKVIKTGITNVKEIQKILQDKNYRNIFVWSDSAGTFYDWHTHTYEEVRWVYKGKVKIGYEGGEIELKPGDMLLISPNTKHWAETDIGVSYVCASK